MVLFKDICSASENLLFKGFAHENPWAVDIKHRLANPTFVQGSSLTNSGKLNGTCSTGFAMPQGGSVTGTIDIDGLYTLGISQPFILTNGLCLTSIMQTKFSRKQPYAKSIDVAADLKQNYLHSKFSLSPLTMQWTASTTGSFPISNGLDTAVVGVEIGGGRDAKLRRSFATAMTWNIKEHTIIGGGKLSPLTSAHPGKFSCFVVTKSPKSMGSEMGAEMSYNFPDDQIDFTFGASWNLDTKPKPTQLKMKMNHLGFAAAALTHKVSDNFSLTVGCQIDAVNKITAGSLEDPEALKFGVKFNLLA